MCSECGTTTPSEFKIYGKSHFCDYCWKKIQKNDPQHPYVIYTN